jgi:Glutaredoxin-like domain (DUF836)
MVVPAAIPAQVGAAHFFAVEYRLEQYRLYSTSACHLCELAVDMLEQFRQAGFDFSYEVIDIALDDALFERYGLLIPVLRSPGGEELNWPFDPQALARMLG